MISLSQINEQLRRSEHPLFYCYFKDEDGKVHNIIYQDGIFISLLNNNKIVKLNPLSEVEVWFNKILSKEYKLIGKGYLTKKLSVNYKTQISRTKARMVI